MHPCGWRRQFLDQRVVFGGTWLKKMDLGLAPRLEILDPQLVNYLCQKVLLFESKFSFLGVTLLWYVMCP